MAERTDGGYSGSGYTGGGYGRDIDLQKSDANGNRKGNSSSSDGTENCGSFIDFISKIQEISVQESKLESGLDKDLFTLQKTICALWSGFKLGLSSMILILLYIIVELVLYVDTIEKSINNDGVLFFIRMLPVFLTVGITLYITTISRFAVGSYTNTAIKTFFAGKLVSTLIVGVLFINLLYYLKPLLLSSNISLFHSIGLEYSENFNSVLTVTFLLVSISAFAPFFIYGFRKIFFSIDRTDEYEKY